MKKFIACFVLENGTYVEVPVDAVIENGKFKEEYAGRFFYPFNQYLLEMSKEDRRYFYLCREVMKDITLFRLNLQEEPLEKLQARNLRLLDKPATAQNMR